jgi:hypothetical protein
MNIVRFKWLKENIDVFIVSERDAIVSILFTPIGTNTVSAV